MDDKTISLDKAKRWADLSWLIQQYGDLFDSDDQGTTYSYTGPIKLQINWLDEWTFPRLSSVVKVNNIKQNIVSLAILNKHGLIGTAVLHQISPEVIELKCFNILASFRKRGIGSYFLTKVEEYCRKKNYKSIQCKLRTYWVYSKYWEKILISKNWICDSVLMHYVIMAKPQTFLESPICQRALSNQTFEYFTPDPENLNELKLYLPTMNWESPIPPGLNPFQMINQIDKQASFIVKKQDRIIGWLFGHQVKPRIWQVTTLYLTPKERGRGIEIIAESFKRHDNRGTIHFMIRPENYKMLLFSLRYLVRFGAILSEQKKMIKYL